MEIELKQNMRQLLETIKKQQEMIDTQQEMIDKQQEMINKIKNVIKMCDCGEMIKFYRGSSGKELMCCINNCHKNWSDNNSC